ncbi:uncharacterized protein LOC118759861 [Ochotona princeps]|uniref:uncharacterized protein LOC118759861 n=1 Tax=Ochotona princeps TaxID=9978 RepID=UPI002714F15B|nr:uncharacterized protein LOC118759861 [Ochotona princeps]
MVEAAPAPGPGAAQPAVQGRAGPGTQLLGGDPEGAGAHAPAAPPGPGTAPVPPPARDAARSPPWLRRPGSSGAAAERRARLQPQSLERLVERPRQMDSFPFDDISSMIQNEATERIISPMSVRLCHLLISMEKAEVEDEAFGSLEETAEDLAEATEAFVEKARRLAADSGEQWLRAEVEPAVESLLLSGRNVTQVARKLRLQPACQRHREELATMAQQMVVATTKVLLLQDAATARRAALEAGCCLNCLDALEAADDAASLSRPFADLALALLRLGHLTARGGEADRLLWGCIPALVAVARGHLRYPCDPQLAASRRRVLSQTREALSKVLALLEPRASSFPAQTLSRSGALTRRLQQVRELLLATPTPGCLHGLLDAPLAAVLGHCMYLAAGCAPPERLHLVVRCRRLLELRGSLGAAGTGRASLDSAEERAALWAAAQGLSQGVRTGLLSQILDTFTDTLSPLQSLIQAAQVIPPEDCLHSGEASPTSLQPFLAAFLEQAGNMLRVAHLVLVCCSRPQTGRDLEAAAAGLWALVVRVQQFFSQDPRDCDLDLSPDALQALLQAWAAASDHLLSCFDDVLDIPEFLSACIREMTRRLPFLARALSSGVPTELRRPVVYLQARAAHMVQVMNRYVGRERDPIFRNGLRVLIQQLAQASGRLGAAAESCSAGHSLRDTGVVLAAARQLVCSAQSILEGLDGTNHPDILSPLRFQVLRFGTAEGQPLVLPGLWDVTAPELKHHQVPGFREWNLGTFCSPRVHPSCPSIPGMDPPGSKEDCPLSAINKLVLAVKSRDPEGPTSGGFSLPEQGAGQETLAGEGFLGSERMPGPQEVSTLPPSFCKLPREVAHGAVAGTDRLLEATLQLPGRTREARQDLVAAAGDWYLLCQQLFCHSQTADLPGSMATFMELQQNLASMVQLAAKSVLMDLDKKGPISTGHPETFAQMQGRWEEAETHAKQLMDQLLASDRCRAVKSWGENIEDRCLLWSTAIQSLIRHMEKLNERQGLFLLPLRQAVRHQQGWKEGLDRAAHASQRLQEVARLSGPLCGNEQVQAELSFLGKEVHVLTDALLFVAQLLVSSPKPAPSLSTRFELLCLELTLRAKALTDHFRSIHADYMCALKDAFCSRHSISKDPQTKPGNKLEAMVSGIQAVQAIVAGSGESGPCQDDLTVALDSILVLTKEVAQRLPVLREHLEEWEMQALDLLQWEWAAKVHSAMAQLQAWKGGHSEAWRLLAQCLKPGEDLVLAPVQDFAQPGLHHKTVATGTEAVGSVNSQDAIVVGTPRSTEGTCSAEIAPADLGMQHNGLPAASPGHPAWPQTELAPPLPKDGSADNDNRLTQITQEMTETVLRMAQSLRKRCLLTKDELITSARKVATCAQEFARLICMIAKNCVDRRCSQELVCRVEQIRTMSNQLRIISSVKASLARSKSSEELLVGNAQQLLQAVWKAVRAAEAASLRGLRSPHHNPEELEIAALCMQWKRRFVKHRLQETSTRDWDEWGLRKANTEMPPTLAALIQS